MFIAVTGFFPFYIFFLYPIPQLYKKFKREELKNLKGSFAHTEREREAKGSSKGKWMVIFIGTQVLIFVILSYIVSGSTSREKPSCFRLF
jgi:glycerol uptake facilitator-like aquaporin